MSRVGKWQIVGGELRDISRFAYLAHPFSDDGFPIVAWWLHSQRREVESLGGDQWRRGHMTTILSLASTAA